MTESRQALLARVRLDERLSPFKQGDLKHSMPNAGWVRSIRNALGMTLEQLGKRLDVTAATVADVERSESNGTVQLNTLRRVATALDCDLVYALVPRRNIVEIVESRRDELAQAAYRRTAHSMALEDQLEDDPAGKAIKIQAIRDAIPLRGLWRE
jgi:predicted DNA-binding mobile mystery protein A